MMNYKITFKVNGKEVSQEEIRHMELNRYQLVFDELFSKGIVPTFKGKEITKDQVSTMSLQDLTQSLAETRENLGRKKTLDLYREELALGDAMWHDFAKYSRSRENLKPGVVEVETEGISLEQFMLLNQSIAKQNNLFLPSTIHPEHYYFEATDNGGQVIVERFGQYKYPVHLNLMQPAKDDKYTPVPVDKDTDFAMTGYTHLASDDSDTKIIGMHQFKNKKKGLVVKLGVYLPEAVPEELVTGHQWHLMVEFNNCLHKAAQIKPNFFQKIIFKLALKRLKNKYN
ncbi:hypothetical protein [Staphylococcus sp. GDX8P80P]|uniref:hypothetical protein n=1 Tax=Staphylococcus sp. GDX8P80P TaxID=2804104 RepID=UPI001AEBAD48|nr:hypothetical protein [Staphylococcus sp. GDX8P80P]